MTQILKTHLAWMPQHLEKELFSLLFIKNEKGSQEYCKMHIN